MEQVHLLHSTALPAMKFTAEISDTETIFLDPVVYQGNIQRKMRKSYH